MGLKKNLKLGQASLEYFILLAVIVAITILAGNTFLANLSATIQGTSTTTGVFQRAVERITQ